MGNLHQGKNYGGQIHKIKSSYILADKGMDVQDFMMKVMEVLGSHHIVDYQVDTDKSPMTMVYRFTESNQLNG